MTLKQLIDSGITEILIKSYGYIDLSPSNQSYKAFKDAEYITFSIDKDGSLNNPTFWFEEEPSLEDEFELKDGKYVSIMDYDLCSLG